MKKPAQRQVWIADDDKSIRWVLERALAKQGLHSVCFQDAASLLERLRHERPEVIISDIRMPGLDGLSLLQQIKLRHPDIAVIVMTAYSDLDRTVAAFQGGAYEYLSKPFDVAELTTLVERALRRRGGKDSGGASKAPSPSQEPAEPQQRETGIIGSAAAMQEVFRAIGRLSRSRLTVLISGESGSGKELVAAALHRHSPRREAPFIALNSAAIPGELLEAELFGHEKGAFTGADSRRAGRFEQADGGTLFLDEIGDMPLSLQTRLLRVLAAGEFYRLGGRKPLRVDVRVIAATHQDLEQRARDGLFREDLFHRLNVIRVRVPALRERREDIPALIDCFLQRAAAEVGEERKLIPPATLERLTQLPWPGNVRQLENFCRWITVMAPAREVHIDDLPPELLRAEKAGGAEGATADWEAALRRHLREALSRGQERILHETAPALEKILIEEALKQSGGQRLKAAQLLGWSRNTLTRKIREMEL